MTAQTILLVDDERDILDTMKVLIEGVLGVRVLTATSGQEGLDALRHNDVTLVVSDYKMPLMDGLEFLALAYGIRPDVPRVMMTAFPDMELAIRALNQARITQFLPKPIQPESLLATIRSLIAEQRTSALRAEAFGRAVRLAAPHRPKPAEGRTADARP